MGLLDVFPGTAIPASQIASEVWASYTPQIDQGASTNIAKTVNYARYFKIGRFVQFNGDFAVTGSGTASQAVVVALPVAAATSSIKVIGVGYIYNASTDSVHKATVQISTTTTAVFRPTNTTANDFLGSAGFTEALASGDLISYCGTYEAAS